MSKVPKFPEPGSRHADEGTSCATCGTSFSKLSSKFNCPCCGKLCCPDCVQAERTLVMGSTPSKVCIDCFSMLQSCPNSAMEQAPLPEGSNGARSALHRTNMDAGKKTDTSVSSFHVNRSCGNDSLTTTILASASPALCNHVERLLRDMEQLREENVVLLKRIAEQEMQIRAMRESREVEVAQAAAKEKLICDMLREQTRLEQMNNELRNRLSNNRTLVKTLEEDGHLALSNTESNDEIIRSLQQRISCYECELEHLRQIQRCAQPIDRKSLNDIVSRRRLPVSIVQDTVLTVLPPKPRGQMGAGCSLSDWGFDSMEMSSRVPSVLQTVAAEVASQWDFFSTKAEEQKWAHLAAAVENNYRANPYHNAVHAADVLQGVFSLVMMAQPLQQHLTALEKKALAFAAMTHDVRHPGRTNGFLSAIHDPVSFQFSGRGTLEQMHTATAFELLAVPELDFTTLMDDTSFLTFKNTVTQLVTHTDMMLHRDSMARWGVKAGNGGFDCKRAEDRLEALTLILHAADIGASSRGVVIAKKWLVVLDEFAEQAEDEQRRGLPVTPGFTRPESVERSQIFFLDLFVIPTFDLLQQLFPSITEPLLNLRALRELYARVAGVTTPFPPSVDYTNRDARIKELEECIAACRQREGEVYHHLSTIKTAGEKLKKKSTDVKTREADLDRQLRLMLNREDRMKGSLMLLERFMRNEGDLADVPEGSNEVLVSDGADSRVASTNSRGDELVDRREALLTRERSVREREAALEASSKIMRRREMKLANYSERLAEIAENVHKAKKRLQNVGEREASLLQHESALNGVSTSAMITTTPRPFPVSQSEAEEHLAKKYSEVDGLLLLVRAMRVECGAKHDNEVRQQELCAMLAEREAAIAEAVELSRQRRQQAVQGKALHSSPTHLDRLESAIFQLTAAVTLLTE